MAIDVILRRLWAMAERGATVTADDMRAAIDLPAGGGGRGAEATSRGLCRLGGWEGLKTLLCLAALQVDQQSGPRHAWAVHGHAQVRSDQRWNGRLSRHSRMAPAARPA